MPNPGLSQEEIDRRTEAARRHMALGFGWVKRAADELGINRTTFRWWCNENDIRAPEPIDQVAEGFALKGYSEFTKTEHGTPIWLKTVKAEQDYYRQIEEAIERVSPVLIKPVPFPKQPSEDIIPWLQIGDAHIAF